MTPNYFIGLMTGTSCDGFDAVLLHNEANQYRYEAMVSLPMPELLKKELLALTYPTNNELERTAQAAWLHAQQSAKAVRELFIKTGLTAKDICAIGSHGQTLRHHPNAHPPYTIQIQNPALLAELTGIDVIADFRARDIAAGGQGAPLAPLFHRGLFTHDSLTLVNIGGIANISILSESGEFGFDTGPGNGLMDSWILKTLGKDFDDKGNWAKSGTIIARLLRQLLSDVYFSKAPPKSSGRDSFNLAWLEAFLTGDEAPEDVQRTLLELTACTIGDAINHYGKSEKIVLAGGGAKNHFLRERISSYLYLAKNVRLIDSDIPEQALEAAGFAWLAAKFIAREPLHLHATTGGKTRILGALYPA